MSGKTPSSSIGPKGQGGGSAPKGQGQGSPKGQGGSRGSGQGTLVTHGLQKGGGSSKG